jgi:hypothetical protein
MQSIYHYTVPIFTKILEGLKQFIVKTESSGIDEGVLLHDSLASDMFPFVRQVQIACDNAKGATARLAGIEVPSFPDTESSLAELKNRIDATIAFISSVPEDAFADAENRMITLPYFPERYFTGGDYVREYAIPNFIFHVTTAYGLMRKAGAPIGKADFLNGLTLHPISDQ